ncbi:MAG: single-stranded DNA-binding protein [Magnetococcales bacterium]|nr:single-stranded DNA-binding protein [Magnetococcales bacterium]
MSNTNKCFLIGHVGSVQALRTLQDGTSVLGFSLAVTQKRKGNQSTQWFDVGLFGQRADALEPHIKKGDPICVEGPVTLNEYQDRQGNQRAKLKIFANHVDLLRSRNSQQTPATQPQAPHPQAHPAASPQAAQPQRASQHSYFPQPHQQPSQPSQNNPPMTTGFADDMPF